MSFCVHEEISSSGPGLLKANLRSWSAVNMSQGCVLCSGEMLLIIFALIFDYEMKANDILAFLFYSFICTIKGKTLVLPAEVCHGCRRQQPASGIFKI